MKKIKATKNGGGIKEYGKQYRQKMSEEGKQRKKKYLKEDVEI